MQTMGFSQHEAPTYEAEVINTLLEEVKLLSHCHALTDMNCILRRRAMLAANNLDSLLRAAGAVSRVRVRRATSSRCSEPPAPCVCVAQPRAAET